MSEDNCIPIAQRRATELSEELRRLPCERGLRIRYLKRILDEGLYAVSNEQIALALLRELMEAAADAGLCGNA